METAEVYDIVPRSTYFERLGLKIRPFGMTPDPAFYFDSRTHSEALRGLQSFLQRKEGFALIYGDVGTGKTILCRHFLDGLDRRAHTVGFIINSMMNEDEKQFLTEVLRAFGIMPRSLSTDADMFETVRSLVTMESAQGKQSILVIDEAQLLSDDLLALLAKLSDPGTTGDRGLCVVLFAQEEMASRLVQHHMRYLRRRITTTHCLLPLSPDEIGPYIMHRLVTAGSCGEIRFDKNVIEKICRVSEGYARIINTVSDRCLFVLDERSKTTVNRRIINRILKEESIRAFLGQKTASKTVLKNVLSPSEPHILAQTIEWSDPDKEDFINGKYPADQEMAESER
jgi:general secretion pathway protein A